MEQFRTRTTEAPVSSPEPLQSTETKNLVNDPLNKEITSNPEFSKESALDKWEIQNGKYGLDFLGIKELATELPMKLNFGILDKHIKETLAEKGYDKTPESWQNVLREMEDEIGSRDLNAYDRMKKLVGYIKVVQRLNSAKKLKESYLMNQMSS